jgi:hypothetical protein
VAQRERSLKVFEEFQLERPDQPYSVAPFHKLPAHVVASAQVYEDLAYYLINEYKIKQGPRKEQHLDSTTALPYLNQLLHYADELHGQG